MNFSIRLARRNAKGEALPGQYVEFETNSAAELAEFYDKAVMQSRPGKRHNHINSKKVGKHSKGGNDDAQLRNSTKGEQAIL